MLFSFVFTNAVPVVVVLGCVVFHCGSTALKVVAFRGTAVLDHAVVKSGAVAFASVVFKLRVPFKYEIFCERVVAL